MKKLTKKILDDWAQMTDDNLHYEVRYEIAKWFSDLKSKDDYVDGKYISYVGMFDELLNAVRTTENGMPQCQCFITHCMLEDIRREYGEETYRKVNNCL